MLYSCDCQNKSIFDVCVILRATLRRIFDWRVLPQPVVGVCGLLVGYSTGVGRAVTTLGSENGQSISFQNLLSASHLFMLCDLTLSTETVRQLQSFCQITAPS